MSVEASAPGKVILHGEHAVVYGKKAIAVSVDLYTKIKISPRDDDFTSVQFSDIGIDHTFPLQTILELKCQLGSHFTYESLSLTDPIAFDFVAIEKLDNFIDGLVSPAPYPPELKSARKSAFKAYLYILLAVYDTPPAISVTVETDLPVGAGLGSSASFAVALAGGLLVASGRMTKKAVDIALVNRWAFVSERFVHGTPSGIDNSVASFGDAVVFEKGQPLIHLQCQGIRVILVNTQVPRSTKDLVAKVAALKESQPQVFVELLNGIEMVVDEALIEIKSRGRTTPDLVSRNQTLLKYLGVSHPSLESVIEIAQQHGVRGKLTGAGGGGCAFLLISPDVTEESVQNLVQSLEEKSLPFWNTYLGCRGFSVV